jgi:hypothetical protein
MSSGITYVTVLDLNDLPIEPPEARKANHSNMLADFKLETMSPSPSMIGGSCLRPQWTALEESNEKIKYPDGVDEEFVKTATLISMG